jgi:hypothetical protein
MHKIALDPIYNSPASGKLGDQNSYHFGNWIGKKAIPTILNPLYKATKAVDTPLGRLPGWGNSLISGGLGGAALGGLFNKLRGGSFGKGALIGGGLGAAGLTAVGHMTSGPGWFQKIPGIGKYFPGDQKTQIAGNSKPTSMMGRPLGQETYDQQDHALGMEKLQHVKQALWGQGGANTSDISRKIFQDTKLTLMQKQELSNQVKNLNAQQANRLNQMISSAFGGGIGLVVAKYLLGLGKFGTILTTIASGLLGASMGRGQSPKPTHDAYGRPYYM